MKYSHFGKIQVIRGQTQGRFPFCNSLLIADHVKAVIDPGAGLTIMKKVREDAGIDRVINSHFHFDHIAYNYLFDRSRIYLNDVEADCYRNRKHILQRLGMIDYYGDGWAQGWLDRISRPDTVQSPYSPQNRHEWWLSTSRVDGIYRWGDRMDFGSTKAEVIGAPGHSAGFCCFHFPAEGVVYVGDMDLTSFGPWYFGADGDIEQFIDSLERIANLDAGIFITGHEKGVVSRDEFRKAAQKFIEVIEHRDRAILAAIDGPTSMETLHSKGLIYDRKFHTDAWLRAWDMGGLKKHLNRLVANGSIRFSEERYSKL